VSARREYVIRYRRAGGVYRQARFFQSRPAVERFLDRLLAGDRPDLAELREVSIEAREVGPWELEEIVR
jgi:hypothetical protein